VAVVAAWLGLGLAARAQYLPSPVGAARMPEPLPCGPSSNPPPPKLVPGPISPEAAPPGPADCLSLPANHSSAFQCEHYATEEAFYLSLGSQALQRQKLGKGWVAVIDPTDLKTGITNTRNAPIAQRFEDLSPDMNFGVGGTAGYLWGNQAVELTAFYLFPRDAFLQTDRRGRLDIPFSNPPLGFEGDNGLWAHADRVRTTLNQSQLSAELNYRYWNAGVLGWECTAGIRYFDVLESLNIFTGDDDLSFLDVNGNPDPQRQATYRAEVHNRIVAPQLGLEYSTPLCCWLWVGWSGKVALGPNFIDTRVRLTRGDGFRAFDTTRSTTAFGQVYDVGMHLDLHLLERLRVRAGYNALWLVGVATSVDQVDFNLQNTAGRQNKTGSIFYHGPMVELQLLF
jgi:hypothetical protein